MPMQPLMAGNVKKILSSRDDLAIWEQDDTRILSKPLPPEPAAGTLQWRDWDAQRRMRQAAEERQRQREGSNVDASINQGVQS